MKAIQQGNYFKYQVFKSFDIFGQNVHLNLNKEDSYRTAIGGFLSLVILAVVAIFFQSNIIQFFQKSAIDSSIKTAFYDDPDLIDLNDNNFMIAFSIEQTNYTDRPFFNITVEQRDYVRLDNGTLIKNKILLNLVPCTFDRFDSLFKKQGKNFTDQYNQMSLGKWLCPDYGYSFKVSGRYASTVFDFLKIAVTNCSNTTSPNQNLTWKPVCASETEKLAHLKSEGQFKIQLYMTNYVMNPQYPKDYATLYLDDELYFTFVPYQLSRQANIFFRKYNFETDQSLLPLEDIESEAYNVRGQSDYRDLTELGRNTDSQFAIFYLRRSTFSMEVGRSFQKLDDLMSYLGGFLQIMVVFFGFFVEVYNKQSYLVELSNQLFDFDFGNGDPDEDKSTNQKESQSHMKQNSNLVDIQQSHTVQNEGQKDKTALPVFSKSFEKQKSSLQQQDSIKQMNSMNSSLMFASPKNQQLLIDKHIEKHQQSLSKLEGKSTKQYLQEQIIKVMNKGHQIKFGCKFFLAKLLCERMMKDKQLLLLSKAVDKINEELDIYSILERLNEVEKLKGMILKKPQLILFNFTPKPLISLKETKIIPNKSLVSSQHMLQSSKISHNRSSSKLSVSSKKLGLEQVSKIALKIKVEQEEEQIDKNSPQYICLKLYKAYEEIMTQMQAQDKEQEYVNRQLIKKIGPEILSVFEVSYQMNNQEQQRVEQEKNNKVKGLIQNKLKGFGKKKQQQQQDEGSEGNVSINDDIGMFSQSGEVLDRSQILSRQIGRIDD